MKTFQPAAAYKSAQVVGRRPEQLIVLLYHELLLSLRKASVNVREREFEKKSIQFGRASAIIVELLGALDFEAGGEIAGRLAALYRYFLSEIEEVSRSLDADRLTPVIEMVGSLHSAWEEAVKAAPTQGH